MTSTSSTTSAIDTSSSPKARHPLPTVPLAGRLTVRAAMVGIQSERGMPRQRVLISLRADSGLVELGCRKASLFHCSAAICASPAAHQNGQTGIHTAVRSGLVKVADRQVGSRHREPTTFLPTASRRFDPALWTTTACPRTLPSSLTPYPLPHSLKSLWTSVVEPFLAEAMIALATSRRLRWVVERTPASSQAACCG